MCYKEFLGDSVNNRRGLPFCCRCRRFRCPLPCLWAAVAVAVAVEVRCRCRRRCRCRCVVKPAPSGGFGGNSIIVPFPFCRSAVFSPSALKFFAAEKAERVKDKSYSGGGARGQPKPPPQPPKAAAAGGYLCLFRCCGWFCVWMFLVLWCGWWNCFAVAVSSR